MNFFILIFVDLTPFEQIFEKNFAVRCNVPSKIIIVFW